MTDLLIDDREFLTPVYGPSQKWDEAEHPRHPKGTSEGGRFVVTPEAFIEARDKSTRKGFLSPLSPEDLKGYTLYVSHDGKVGGAMSPKGDMGNLFNNGGPKGAAQDLLLQMIADGGLTADAYDGFLPELYANFGLFESGRMKFNPEYAPPGWDFEKDDSPDVIFLALTGKVGKADADKTKWVPVVPTTNYYDDYELAQRDALARAESSRAGSPVPLRTDQRSGVDSETRKLGVDRSKNGWRSLKGEHTYGSTHVMIDPWSSAAQSLNTARNFIRDEDRAGGGKDVDPNHLTVRYGLLNDDLDGLRAFIAAQHPFPAQVTGIELFPASEHSDGAVPVVARIFSPELHAVELEIGKYADFKEKSFPVYKPHCTLAYCKPEASLLYAEMPVGGTFLIHSITISHASGVQETIPFGMAQKRQWDPAKHPREHSGSSHGGEFMETLHGPQDALDSLLAGEKNVSIDRNDVRKFLELAREQPEHPDLTDLRVEGMMIFGGNGLGIKRDDMPVIPRKHRERFLEFVREAGIRIMEESVDPLTLKPTQSEVSARDVALKLEEYETTDKKFPPLLVAQNGRILDGHHHWGMMAALVLDYPDAKVPIYRMMASTRQLLELMHEYDRIHGIQRKKLGQKADPKSGRYVTPFVSFDKQGDDQLRMIASLNSSRLATWGFTAEAEVRGLARYRITAVLDGRTSKFCRFIDGKIFDVTDAREKVIEALNVQDPNDLRVVQPWPKQNRAAMAQFATMSSDELVARGLHIPPYHPYCRTLLRPIKSSAGELTEKDVVPMLPAEVGTFQPVTLADLQELGVEATQEQLDLWNAHIGMSPVELLSKLSGVSPQEVMTEGVGARPIQFDDAGNIGIKARGEVSGVEFKLGALLDPFTGIYYLSYADLLAGTPLAEAKFLKRMFSALIDMGKASPTVESLAVGVAGNAAYYAKMGFLPDEIEWDNIRQYALDALDTTLQPMMASLSLEDQALVKHLLQDRSVSALSALVDLPFTYEGKSLGEYILGEIGGTWALDLTDEAMLAQAEAYLS